MRRVAVATLVVAVLSACATRKTVSPPAVLDTTVPTGDQLLSTLSARRQLLRSIRAMARLSYSSPEESRRAKQVILAERPDRLRLEVLSPLGAVFVLTTSGGRLAAYARNESTVYRGAASPTNLERYTSVDLPVHAAVDLLMGTPPMAAAGSVVVSRDDGLVKMWQEAGPAVRVTWFTPELDPIRFEQHDDQGQVLLRATFAAYTAVSGVRLPTQIALETPASQRQVTIELLEPEVNPPLPDTLFALDTPQGSKEIDLDQVAN